MKKEFICRFCGHNDFEKKAFPKYYKKPPLKVGVICLQCGETLVVSVDDFAQNFLKEKK
jgi:transcription elongation factor Elf1